MVDWESRKEKEKKKSVGRTSCAHLYVHELLDELHSVLKLSIKKKYFGF